MEDDGETTAEYDWGTSDDALLGIYLIRRQIASGGITRCYEALDLRFGEFVALHMQPQRVSPGPRDSGNRGPLYNEAAILRRLDHPGIVRILDYRDEDEQGPFLVTELIHWETFDQLLVQMPARSRSKLLPVIRDVADALSHCHSLGIVHHDIKPTNIFAEKIDGQFHTKLAGFYLASRLGNPGYPPGAIAGTPLFMSPEQLRGEVLTAKSDVYSLGVVLFEVLTGEPLFRGQLGTQEFETWRLIEDVNDSVLARVPSHGRPLLARMLSFDPSARPDMRSVHAELNSLTTASNDSRTAIVRDHRRRAVANDDHGRAPGVTIAVVLGVLAMAITDAVTGGRSGGLGFLVGAFIGLILTIVMGIVDTAGGNEASRAR